MKFSDRFKQLRNEKGMTQDELCEDIKEKTGYVLTQPRLTHWEIGKHMPDTDVCIILADYFQVSMDYLVGHSDIRTPLTEFDEYKLNPTEKYIIDTIRTFPVEYGAAVEQLLQVTQKIKE